MLEYSINEIKSEEKWEEDPDFKEAVEEDWKVIVRLCKEMKEKILRLYELKYHPEDSKIEELLNIDRVDTREARA
jgi:L-rhamnose isomerase